MKYRVKGYAAIPVVGIILIAGAVGFAVGVGGTLWYMSNHQGGLGDGDSMQPFQEETAVSDMTIPAETEIETETETEPPSTEPVTVNGNRIEVTVSGNAYLYNRENFTLEQIIGIVRANPELPVGIREDGASMRAYQRLCEELELIGAEIEKLD